MKGQMISELAIKRAVDSSVRPVRLGLWSDGVVTELVFVK